MAKRREEPGQIEDASDLRKYRTEFPNLIDDMGLSPHAYRLYGHLKRVAGDEGRCYQTTRTLAKACCMSIGMVSKAKSELLERELIRIEKRQTKNGFADDITIIDIWAENFLHYSGRSLSERVHNMNAIVQNMNNSVHDVKHKKNPNKKNPIEEDSGATAPDTAPEQLRLAPPHSGNSRKQQKPRAPSLNTLRKQAYSDAVTARGLQTNRKGADKVLDELDMMGATPEEITAAVNRALDELGWKKGAYYFDRVPDAVRSYRASRNGNSSDDLFIPGIGRIA